MKMCLSHGSQGLKGLQSKVPLPPRNRLWQTHLHIPTGKTIKFIFFSDIYFETGVSNIWKLSRFLIYRKKTYSSFLQGHWASGLQGYCAYIYECLHECWYTCMCRYTCVCVHVETGSWCYVSSTVTLHLIYHARPFTWTHSLQIYDSLSRQLALSIPSSSYPEPWDCRWTAMPVQHLSGCWGSGLVIKFELWDIWLHCE